MVATSKVKKKTVWYLLDTAQSKHIDATCVNCMVCEQAVTVNVDTLLSLTNDIAAITVHHKCYETAVKTWGNGIVI